jgi:hypothetical protein
MKHESQRKYRLNAEMRADADACRKMTETFTKVPNKNCLQGFAQRISQTPFGVLFHSHLQVSFDFI